MRRKCLDFLAIVFAHPVSQVDLASARESLCRRLGSSAILLAGNGAHVPVLPSCNLENVDAEDVRETLRPYRGRITYLGFDDDAPRRQE
jgi:hypothetical protein